MYKSIPTVLTSEEILDKAFKKANKIENHDRHKMWRERRLTEDRMNCIDDVISNKLRTYIKTFPSLNKIDNFEEALIDLLVDGDKMKQSLGALKWVSRTVHKHAMEGKRLAKHEKNPEELINIRKRAYGKIAGVVYNVDKNLKYLAEIRETLKKLPTINPDIPTAVVAGAPNVGKSKLVVHLSSATPDVASYPFTTKQLHVGMFEHRHLRYQVLDTPGLLDRPLDERNDIERQAILALRFLPHLVVYVLDPTEECGTSMEEQLHLYKDLLKEFTHTQHILVYNKIDLVPAPKDQIGVSALTGDGVDELKIMIADTLAPIHLNKDITEDYDVEEEDDDSYVY